MIKIVNSDFVISVSDSKMILTDKDEVAFVGRSNVGKSSLINFICSRKALAKTSSTPGRTRLINYFLVNNEFYFVDLPGYGFAKGTKSEQNAWQKLIEGYLENSHRIKLICFLLDIRREVSSEDETMFKYLEYYNFPFIIIATKCDKLSKPQLQIAMQNLSKSAKVGIGDIIPVSTVSKQGREQVVKKISQFIGGKNE